LLLQASRDFAFQQLAQAGHFMPFATRVKTDGEMDFIRFADDASEEPMEEIYRLTQQNLAQQARQGEILGAATVAQVGMPDAGEDAEFSQAIQVHVEAPGYSRLVLAPYRVDDAEAEGELPYLVDGDLVPLEAAPAIFAG
jgi:hypothetical protein